jgi:hypothetical protein
LIIAQQGHASTSQRARASLLVEVVQRHRRRCFSSNTAPQNLSDNGFDRFWIAAAGPFQFDRFAVKTGIAAWNPPSRNPRPVRRAGASWEKFRIQDYC